MKTISIKLIPLGKEILAREGTPLIDILHEYGVEFPCGGKGTCGSCKVKVVEGEIEADSFHAGRLNELNLGRDWRLACQSICNTDLVLEVGQYETIIQADETEFDFIPGKGLGIAFDLGTTTLVCQLLNLATGRILAVETSLNPQHKFGSDLISRLESSLSKGSDEMTRIIRSKIREMIGKMMDGRSELPDRIVIVGNTVMHHFFCGYDITPLSFYPFESDNLAMACFTSDELGWDKFFCNNISFYPSIGSFVGSDILAGIMATGMYQKEDYSVLIDLGTNGEIVIGNNSSMLCASTAAGPAFEGAKISMGMLATTGAISSIEPEGEGWKCRVIGNGKPTGICGSGLIDAVSILLENGTLGMFGEILSGETTITLDAPVKISQKDIQEFQLAKAAIATGIEILLRKLSIDSDDIAYVYIAGGFGSYINLNNVNRLGMLSFSTNIMHQLGNTALIGAKMFLFADQTKQESILSLTDHVNLESEPDFQDLYVKNLMFP